MYDFEFPAPPALDVVLSDALKAAALAEGTNLNNFVHYDPSCRNGREVHRPHTPPSSLDSSNNDEDYSDLPDLCMATESDIGDNEGPPPLEDASAVEQPAVGAEEPPVPRTHAWIFTTAEDSTPYDGEGIEAVWAHMSAPRSVQLEGEKGMQINDKTGESNPFDLRAY